MQKIQVNVVYYCVEDFAQHFWLIESIGLIDWLIFWLIDILIDWYFDWLIDWSIESIESIDRTTLFTIVSNMIVYLGFKISERNLKKKQFKTQRFDTPV